MTASGAELPIGDVPGPTRPADQVTVEPVDAAGRHWRYPRVRRYLRRPHHVGVILALVAFLCSLTPSLLPRSWEVQGIISGIEGAVAHATGVAISWVAGRAGIRPLRPWTQRRLWYGIGVFAAVAVPTTLWLSARWQADIRQAVNMPAEGHYWYLGMFAIAVAVAAGLVGLTRLFHDVYLVVMRRLLRFIPLLPAKLLASVLVTALVVGLFTGVVYRGLVHLADNAFSTVDRGNDDGVVQPTSPIRSGSPASLAPWTSLGRQGRAFVSSGPTATDIQRLTGRPMLEPIRVYAGLSSTPTPQGQADLVLAELKRSGAFDRPLLAVATTTGTGWVDPTLADPLEYTYSGNTAIAAMQYSYLPSWISFLVDKDRARQAGRTLFTTVHRYWSTLPPTHRPRLVVFGESLGAFGGSAAFSGLTELGARADGALFVGPPNSTQLWRTLTNERAAGSPERLPIFGDGQTVRFAASAADLRTADGSLRQPRVVFLQHASDPIVWWSPQLIWREPDWLHEPRGPDVVPQMHWFPFLTFWQVTCDMIVGVKPPPGHGHHYGPEVSTAWAVLLHPPH
ncbi:MAG: alpha/beta-hydrolase family protein [Pseudonocardiales bacterium]|nr:alpha/beta-hydrolase family protein [Pseudonocardiales bacterium]